MGQTIAAMRRTIFDDNHELFRQSVRAFVEQEIVPHFEKWEHDRGIDRNLYRKAGELGLLAMAAPEKYGGGANNDFRFNAVITEELCRAGVLNAGQGMILHTNIVLPYFIDLANDDQKARWLPQICSGEFVTAIAMTEPGAGSDLGAITTTARRTGDGYLINGSKMFISNGSICDLVIVVCKTGNDDRRHHNLSLIVVEATTPGFHRGRALEKIGQHSADTAELFFDDVHVPVSNRLGDEGEAFVYSVTRLAQERLSIALAALWHAEAAFEWTLAYTKDRRAFGTAVASFQNSRFVLATLRTELDIGRTYLDQQLLAHTTGDLSPEDAAAAKWWCTELNKRVLDACLQLHGGYGYMDEYPIARAWRDGRAMSIYGGTTEIMKEIIGRRVLGV